MANLIDFVRGIKHRAAEDACEGGTRNGARGICSVCSSHPAVLDAVFDFAAEATVGPKEFTVCIESTSNQVNQYGGYTGMMPADFSALVRGKAVHFPFDSVVLGGDHLGPNPWKDRPAEEAMEEAAVLVRAYAEAGFQKIHIDTSMFLADDPGDRTKPLDPAVVAERTARLIGAAEKGGARPYYVVGSEVPVPGGVEDTGNDNAGDLSRGPFERTVEPTTVESVQKTLDLTSGALQSAGLRDAAKRIIAVVVQPGVEFGDGFVLPYRPRQARSLSDFIKPLDIVYEAHSSDYQTEESLRNLVRDQFAILKVGPELTFAYREAVFALAFMEKELTLALPGDPSGLIEEMDRIMLNDPSSWEKYYTGSEAEQAFKRKYSFSDRIRYYWALPEAGTAVDLLLSNMQSIDIPLTLLSQYMPRQYEAVREGRLDPDPCSLLLFAVKQVLKKYQAAVRQMV